MDHAIRPDAGMAVSGGPRLRVLTPPTDPVAVVLVEAAELLPAVANRPPVLACDVHTALVESATRQAPNAGRQHQLRTASRALDQFLAFLTLTGRVPPAVRASQALRSWAQSRDLAAVQQALVAAADHWRGGDVVG